MNSTLLLTAFSGSQPGPTLLGVDVVWASTMLVAVGIFAVMVAIYGALTVRDPMAKRVKALNDRREQLKAGITASTAKRRARLVRKNHTADKMRTFLGKLQVLQDSQIKEVQQKLAQAGIRSKDLAVAVIFGRLVLPIVFGGIAALLIYWVDMWPDLTPFKRSGATMAMLILGYKAPDLFIQNKRQKRTDAIRKGLPDALDLLVICAEAGLTVDSAFSRVSKELGRAYPELGEEFALTSIELGFLTERRQAFENLAYRVNLESVKGVVTTMIQTEKYGTPLASALRVLSAEFRNERMMRAEEKAARLPAIMTVPLILFILPVLFIVILGPAACSLSDAMSGGSLGGGKP
ncbi:MULTISPECIES: type II secretion system F family protein [Sphingopyxis]|jgi:tight adherence protein C|uniref:Tight adherence protein C n=1 Tax=Sphingopyxis terrae subsp. ummariensis TaxID=429001 RepID=A0A1Y6G0I2_9SPHN|nr:MULTISPECIES: type II secretion system F family protein [Sphingopyxis]OJW27337.1 MAG: pilus assembly protein TadC [Sphingopyxis sp. 65-8]KTE74792.1 pilus assembly protein TadC [Sphingopyxis sp. A083]MBN8806110.1 type II secretion system F family protein [Sphingopyxis terrae]MDX8357990.1 type II secretion system F family protein [Sphingopyxis terrae]PCF90716.1 pilus assembly protein TadC [Sphingopyxis terrae subsp. ummariensis]